MNLEISDQKLQDMLGEEFLKALRSTMGSFDVNRAFSEQIATAINESTIQPRIKDAFQRIDMSAVEQYVARELRGMLEYYLLRTLALAMADTLMKLEKKRYITSDEEDKLRSELAEKMMDANKRDAILDSPTEVLAAYLSDRYAFHWDGSTGVPLHRHGEQTQRAWFQTVNDLINSRGVRLIRSEDGQPSGLAALAVETARETTLTRKQPDAAPEPLVGVDVPSAAPTPSDVSTAAPDGITVDLLQSEIERRRRDPEGVPGASPWRGDSWRHRNSDGSHTREGSSQVRQHGSNRSGYRCPEGSQGLGFLGGLRSLGSSLQAV